MTDAPETESKTYENLSAFADSNAGDYIPGTGAPEPEPDLQLGAEELAFIFSVGFDLLAARRGDHWKLSLDEAEKLGIATDKVLEKYLPNVQTGPEVALILTGGMIALPRLMADKQLAEAKAASDDAVKHTEAEGVSDGD